MGSKRFVGSVRLFEGDLILKSPKPKNAINCIIINDKKIKSVDIVPRFTCGPEQNIVLILDKNQENNLETEFEPFRSIILNGIPTVEFNTNDGSAYYVNVNGDIKDIDAIKIFNKMFGSTHEPLYITKTSEYGLSCEYNDLENKCECIAKKLISLYDYWDKYTDEFGYVYSDYKINFGNNGFVTITHQEQSKNINTGGILIRPLDPENFDSLESFLTKISEGFVCFHHPEPLNYIKIQDYQQQHAKK